MPDEWVAKKDWNFLPFALRTQTFSDPLSLCVLLCLWDSNERRNLFLQQGAHDSFFALFFLIIIFCLHYLLTKKKNCYLPYFSNLTFLFEIKEWVFIFEVLFLFFFFFWCGPGEICCFDLWVWRWSWREWCSIIFSHSLLCSSFFLVFFIFHLNLTFKKSFMIDKYGKWI